MKDISMVTSHMKRSAHHSNVPAMPRLAEKAGHDLARSSKAVRDGLRAIETWFRVHGDPFVPLEPLPFIAELDLHRHSLDTLSNAELIARLSSAFEALHARLASAARGED